MKTNMKPSQVLIEAANDCAEFCSTDSADSKSFYMCYKIQSIELNISKDAIINNYSSKTIDYIKEFSGKSPEIFIVWFAQDYFTVPYNESLTKRELNEMRVLALCFASYIAYLDDN